MKHLSILLLVLVVFDCCVFRSEANLSESAFAQMKAEAFDIEQTCSGGCTHTYQWWASNTPWAPSKQITIAETKPICGTNITVLACVQGWCYTNSVGILAEFYTAQMNRRQLTTPQTCWTSNVLNVVNAMKAYENTCTNPITFGLTYASPTNTAVLTGYNTGGIGPGNCDFTPVGR